MFDYLQNNILQIINIIVSSTVLTLYFKLISAWKKNVESRHQLEISRKDLEIDALKQQSIPSMLNELKNYKKSIAYLDQFLSKEKNLKDNMTIDLAEKNKIVDVMINDYKKRTVDILKYRNPSYEVQDGILKVLEELTPSYQLLSQEIVETLVDTFIGTYSSMIRKRIINLIKSFNPEKLNDILLDNYPFISHECIEDFFILLNQTWREIDLGHALKILSSIQNREARLIEPLSIFIKQKST